MASAPSLTRGTVALPPDEDPPEVDTVARWAPPMLLAVQALLGLGMISRGPSMDETTYIEAGRAEIAHWLHGTAVPGFSRAFSGAPVIYPPLSAAAAAAGGLTGSRLLSLACMLAATALLFSAVRQLFGARAGVVAGALFVTTAAAQYLSVLATYDAMSLMLLAAAARCAVAAAEAARARRRLVLTAATVAAITVANATAYPSALWDPAVIALIMLAGPGRSRASRLLAGLATAGGTAAALAALTLFAGPSYWHGILFSTVARTVNGGHPAAAILGASAAEIGCLTALAVMGATVLTASARDPAIKILGWVLAAAVLLAPAEQARIGVIVSLFKHIGYGAWFAAIPAAYGLARLGELALRRLARSRRSLAAALVIAFLTSTVMVAVAGAVSGVVQARDRGAVPPPYSPGAVYQLRLMLAHNRQPVLADSPSELAFDTSTSLSQWVNTYSFRYRAPGTGQVLAGSAAYRSAIEHRVFSFIILRQPMLGRPVDSSIYHLLVRHGSELGYAAKWSLWGYGSIRHGSEGKAIYIYYRKPHFFRLPPRPGSPAPNR